MVPELLFKHTEKKKTEECFHKSLRNLNALLKEINFLTDAVLCEKANPDERLEPA